MAWTNLCRRASSGRSREGRADRAAVTRRRAPSARWLGALAALAGALVLGPARAQTEARCPAELGAGVECYTGQSRSGAFYWIARPRTWNGILLMHAHGGPRIRPPRADSPVEDLQRFAVFVREGYAWAGSSYRRGGYGVSMAGRDTDQLRRLFIDRFGKPRLTFAHGQSWGGNVAAKLIEVTPKDPDGTKAYDGALLTSGVLAGGTRAYLFRADLRAVYQYYCRNHPRPDEPQYPLWLGLPANSDMSVKDLEIRIDACTGVRRKPEERSEIQKQNLANILNVVRIPEATLLSHVDWATFMFRDLVQKRLDGLNPFSNDEVKYAGSSNDAALNDGVSRFRADPVAVRSFAEDSDMTGSVAIPVVTLHAINDPTAFVEHESAYKGTMEKGGSAGNLVQTFVDEAAHSSLQDGEYLAVVTALRRWVETGTRPTPATIAADCPALAARIGGRCLFKPDYTPPPFFARVYPREP